MASESEKHTVYGYYTDGGVTEGLKADNPQHFTLNGKEIPMHSGSIHYFRVHPQYWRDRLRKLRAAGFVSVETYVPWNLHEPHEGVFDFGDGGEDMSPFLDIRTFLRIAKEEDLLAILRPGPYICAEWEFGGLPSWLLKYSGIKVRTSDEVYMAKVRNYFTRLLPILRELQFSTGNGPIIAFQVENEYGNFKVENVDSDINYLEEIKKLYEEFGLVELFFTSDTPTKGKEYGAITGVLETANFNDKATRELKQLKEFQPNRPSMVMEFWTGWFDHWGEFHHNTTMTVDRFKSVLEEVLSFPSGVNFYMFHGGTTFGFLNGGNVYDQFPFFLPDISSYDYDAPLSESGDYTEKYHATREIFARHQKVPLKHPTPPPETVKADYGPLTLESYLDWDSLLSQADITLTKNNPVYMEDLDINMGSGQNFGYIVYRKKNQKLTSGSVLQIDNEIKGVAIVVVNNKLFSPTLRTIEDLKGFGYWCSEDSKKTLNISLDSADSTVDIIIENWSRNNYGKPKDFSQKRGLTSNQVKIDSQEVTNFEVFPLQFKGSWIRNLTGWKEPTTKLTGPALLRFHLTTNEPRDTFLDMTDWGKGIVFVNGFNVGRYATIGPVHSLFVPAPLLTSGTNYIDVFEHYTPISELKFSKTIIFKDAAETFDTSLL